MSFYFTFLQIPTYQKHALFLQYWRKKQEYLVNITIMLWRYLVFAFIIPSKEDFGGGSNSMEQLTDHTLLHYFIWLVLLKSTTKPELERE